MNEAWDYYRQFLQLPIAEQNQILLQKEADFWEEMGAQKALEVFHAAAQRVPAYKKFLQEQAIDHNSIKTLADFKTIPPINKKNYLRAYPLEELCWDGDLTTKNVISVSSGSTGEPFFWPRDHWQEKEVDHFYNLTFHSLFEAEKKHTLVIIAFAMGMYIAGPFTYASLLRLSHNGYPLTITTPSNDIPAVLRIVSRLGDKFNQIIIGGYPPLVKDIIEIGAAEGINWQEKNTHLFFGGEGYSEKWRDHLHHLLGCPDSLSHTINMYGTADAALVAIESPTSILYRRLAGENKKTRLQLFGSERLPSILTYNPLLKYFETLEDNSLVFTTSSGIPLIRYQIGDVGGVIPYKKVVEDVKQISSADLSPTLKHHHLENTDWKLPLVYLFGRGDFTTHLYGANVYPENIKEALEDKRVHSFITGKFILTTEYRRDMSPYLNLEVELKPNLKSNRTLLNLVKRIIVETLRQKNSEYEVIYTTIKKKAEPKLKLVPYQSPGFMVKIKHNWVTKTQS